MKSNELKSYKEKVRPIALKMGVKYLALFGSFARGEVTKTSDVDVLVEFEKPLTLRHYFATEEKLKGVFGRKVDLITNKGLSKYVRPYIQDDLKVLYGKST